LRVAQEGERVKVALPVSAHRHRSSNAIRAKDTPQEQSFVKEPDVIGGWGQQSCNMAKRGIGHPADFRILWFHERPVLKHYLCYKKIQSIKRRKQMLLCTVNN
jgi:hypothetical protein